MEETDKKSKKQINKELEDIRKSYAFAYECGKCGEVYGSDFEEKKDKLCPFCIFEKKHKRKATSLMELDV